MMREFRSRLYYWISQHTSRDVNQWFYDHFASFSEWWGIYPPKKWERWR